MQDTGIEGKALEALRELAGTMGQAAEMLWPMAVKATYATSVSTIGMSAFFILLALVTPVIVWKVTKRIPFEQEEAKYIFTTIAGVICTIVSIGSLIDIQRSIPGLIAPEGITLFRLLG